MKTLCDSFAEQVRERPNSVAVRSSGRSTTYRDLDQQSNALAAFLVESGIEQGDRIAFLLGNSAEYVVCYLGVLRAGGVVVALNPDTTTSELRETLLNAAPSAIITGSKGLSPLGEMARELTTVRHLIVDSDEAAAKIPPALWDTPMAIATLGNVAQRSGVSTWPSPQPADIAQIIFTSGTTGRPKGVTLSHGNIAANCQAIVDVLALSSDDSMFVTLPFFFSYGNSLLFTHLAVGGKLILASDFVFWNRALDLLDSEGATEFAGVPSSFAMLLHKSNFLERQFASLRYLTCAGGALSRGLIDRIRTAQPGIRFYPMYGQTEATARLSILTPEEWNEKPGSIGRGLPGVELQVLNEQCQPVTPGEVGEIVVRGENVMQGYWNDPEETARVLRPEGLRTGDLAQIDNDGYVTIVGRKNDIIKSGAYRLHPVELESVITQHPLVAEVAVVGVADEIWGERPVAFVVRAAGSASVEGEQLSSDSLIEFCRGRLPRHKEVREFRFVEHLPKTPSGKVRREELRRISRA